MLSRFAPQIQVRLVYIVFVVHMTTIGAVADLTLHALTRLRSYLRSAGRYGASPFLVGHYGGLGEIAQGFCRVSAVNGGVYILGRKIEEITAPTSASGDKFVVNLDDVPGPLTADVLVAAQDQLPLSLHPPPAQDIHTSPIARCIAVIDNPIIFSSLLSSGEGQCDDEVESAPTTSGGEDADGQNSESTTQPESPAEESFVDTSVVVFPPCSVNGGSSTNAAQAFTTGAGTLSAPQGKCKGASCRAELDPTNPSYTDVVYLSIPVADDDEPKQLIEPYLKTILSLAKVSEPLFKLIYVQRVPDSHSLTSNADQPPVFVSPALPSHLAKISDSASFAAESLFFRVVDQLRAKSPQAWSTGSSAEESSGGDVFAELKIPMWPPLEGPEEGGGDW